MRIQFYEYSFIKIVKESSAAYLIDFDGEVEKWVPKSQINIDVFKKKIFLPDWLAIKLELI